MSFIKKIENDYNEDLISLKELEEMRNKYSNLKNSDKLILDRQNTKESIDEDTSSSKTKKFGIISSGVYMYFTIITGIINIILPISNGKSPIDILIESGNFGYFLGSVLAASCFWFISYYFVVIIASIIISIIKFQFVFIQSKWFLILPIIFQLLIIIGIYM